MLEQMEIAIQEGHQLQELDWVTSSLLGGVARVYLAIASSNTNAFRQAIHELSGVVDATTDAWNQDAVVEFMAAKLDRLGDMVREAEDKGGQ